MRVEAMVCKELHPEKKKRSSLACLDMGGRGVKKESIISLTLQRRLLCTMCFLVTRPSLELQCISRRVWAGTEGNINDIEVSVCRG